MNSDGLLIIRAVPNEYEITSGKDSKSIRNKVNLYFIFVHILVTAVQNLISSHWPMPECEKNLFKGHLYPLVKSKEFKELGDSGTCT